MILEVDRICALEKFSARVHLRDSLGNVVRGIEELGFNNKKGIRPKDFKDVKLRGCQKNC